MKLTIGDKAPDFSLFDQNGKMWKFSDFLGNYVLIYFYPKDDTPGCTTEACGLRDNFPKFNEQNIKIIGISADSKESHKKFANKFELPFTLLADTDKQVIQSYGVWQKKKFMGREYEGIVRSSYLVDKMGKIIKIYEKVIPKNHAKEVLEDLANLKHS